MQAFIKLCIECQNMQNKADTQSACICQYKDVKCFVQNNQLDASNNQNLFCHKTLHVSGIFCVHHQEYLLYTWQLVYFMQVM